MQETNPLASYEGTENPSEETNTQPVTEKISELQNHLDRALSLINEGSGEDTGVLIHRALGLVDQEQGLLMTLPQSDERDNEWRKLEAKREELIRRQSELRVAEDKSEQQEHHRKSFLHSLNEIGADLYRLSMSLDEREAQGMDPLLVPDEVRALSRGIIEAAENPKDPNVLVNLTEAIHRGLSNIEDQYRRGGSVNDDPENLAEISRFADSFETPLEESLTLLRRLEANEDTVKELQNVLGELKDTLSNLALRSYRMAEALNNW